MVDEIIFSYSKLRGKIKEVFGTQEAFATRVKMTPATLSQKLNNASEFDQKEIVNAMKALNIPLDEVNEYFFTV